MTASAADEIIIYTDGESDFARYGATTGHEADMDIVSLTCDDSTYPFVVELTVSGTITSSYGSGGGVNKYVVLLDLNGDESKAEMSFELETDGTLTIYTQDGRNFTYPGDQYTIAGSKLSIRIDYSYLGNFERVSDIAASTLQRFDNPSTTVTDSVNYLFGEDNKPFPRQGPADDDVTTDDDTTDDDNTDDDTTDDDDDSPGPSMVLIVLSISIIAFVHFLRRKKE